VWVRAAVVLVVLLWLGWFGYVRWTTTPAAAWRPPATGAPLSEELAPLLTAMGDVPHFPGDPRDGSWWRCWGSLGVALCGPWNPVTNEQLRAVEAHLAEPTTTEVLDAVVAECEALRKRARTTRNLGSVDYLVTWNDRPYYNTLYSLVARARWRHAAKDDAAGALRDLRAAVCARELYDEAHGSLGYYSNGSKPDLAELILLSQERDLPPGPTAETISLLMEDLPFRFSDALARVGWSTAGVQAFLDQHYTDDGAGNGWLVLSRQWFEQPGAPLRAWTPTSTPTPTPPRNRAWNLLSPAFNDRKAVRTKLSRLERFVSRVDSLNAIAALAEIEAIFQQRPRFNMLDGPVDDLFEQLRYAQVGSLLLDVVWRRAAVVMLALSAYKYDRGEYPDSLAELVPIYLPAVPLDLLVNEPFVYERRGPAGYVLRSQRPIPGCVLFDLLRDYPVGEGPSVYSLTRLDEGK
jgi:hypothetical protein